MVKNMCIEQTKKLKNLPGEVETATWTDQDELTCTEMKLDRSRMTKLACFINDWIIAGNKEISLYTA
jgi:hypothetical protein